MQIQNPSFYKDYREPNINLLFGIIWDLKYMKMETMLSKSRQFAEPVKLNFQ